MAEPRMTYGSTDGSSETDIFYEDNWLSTVHRFYEQAEHIQKTLATRYGIDVLIDEVAIMFRGNEEAQEFIQRAMCHEEAGFVHFNAALDGVKTFPIDSSYSVRYDFLREGDNPIRLECMVIQSGVSPLHAAFQDQSRFSTVPVHFSFKCATEFEYHEVVSKLLEIEFQMAQGCISTYGVFSYFVSEEFPSVYLKPRVNTRDAR